MIKLLNRVLVKLDNEGEIKHLARYSKMILENYPEVEIVGLFIHPSIEAHSYMEFRGVGGDYDIKEAKTEHNLKIEKVMEIESKIKDEFLSLVENSSFYSKTGNVSEVLMEELRLFDMAVVSKDDKISHGLRELLKNHNKPLILVPELESYSLERILVADDQGLEVNKSVFRFLNVFEKINAFKAVTVGISQEEVKDLTFYLEKIDKKIEYNFEEGSVDEIILNYAKECDMLIMGNLKRSFMVEKLIGRGGIRALEEVKKPVFIG
ncbi:hypothetical protein [uncultured Ilyobacter sp.]|uniref:hypothetical protein n=1 Tax=uncultured Ilyobacter sp. TaxID=544433 RepID=UPI0029C99700|nr:hypothetical protein [uncultured Ilyobacter sp.]